MSKQSKKSSNTYSSTYASGRASNRIFEITSIRYYVAGALIFLFAIAAGYSCFKFTKVTEFSAKTIYEEAFVEPLSVITDLSGSRGNSLVGFDSWIRFKSSTPITLRNAREFKSDLSEVGRSIFAEKYPLDATLRQAPDKYEYSLHTEHGVGKVVNEGLLINKSNNEYFYRIWGM